MSDSGRRHVSAFDLSKYHTPYQWPPDDRYFRVSRFAPFVRSRTPSPPPSGGDPPAIEANAAEAQAVVVELADAQAAEGRDPTPGLEQREVHHDGDVAEPEPTEAELAMADQLEPQVVVAEVPARPQPAIDGEPMVLDEPLALEAELDQDDPMLRDPTPPVPDAGPSVSRHSAPPQSSDQSRVGSSEPEGPRDRLRRFDALPSFKYVLNKVAFWNTLTHLPQNYESISLQRGLEVSLEPSQGYACRRRSGIRLGPEGRRPLHTCLPRGHPNLDLV